MHLIGLNEEEEDATCLLLNRGGVLCTALVTEAALRWSEGSVSSVFRGKRRPQWHRAGVTEGGIDVNQAGKDGHTPLMLG